MEKEQLTGDYIKRKAHHVRETEKREEEKEEKEWLI